MTKILKQHISLNEHNNITNSVKLANELTKLEVEENTDPPLLISETSMSVFQYTKH